MDRRAAAGTRVVLWALFTVTSLTVVGCDSPTDSLGISDGADVQIAIPLSKAAQARIVSAEVIVDGAGMIAIRVPLEIDGNSMRGTVSGIPEGTSRRFTIKAYGSDGILAYSGSSTASVVAGETVSVRISVTLVITQSVGLEIETPYTRRWGGGITSFTLEIVNHGESDATNVILAGIARNAEGAGLSESSVDVGTVSAQGRKLVDIVFINTRPGETDENYVSTVDYTLTSAEGFERSGVLGHEDPETGVPALSVRDNPTRTYSSSYRRTSFVLEIGNSSSSDVSGVIINARGRNANGSAISDASTEIELILAGKSEIATLVFNNTGPIGSPDIFVTRLDYTITSNSSEFEITGELEVE